MLTEQPTWKIHDSTKVIEYAGCPRSYMFKYIFGWISDKPNVHLHFGTCWHLAQEHLLLHGMNEASYEEAVRILTDKYREVFPEMTDMERSPKNPGHAQLALAMYCKEYRHKDHLTVLFTEIAGVVPISASRVMHFKIDSIVRDQDNNNLIKSFEHKTGSQNSQQWRDGWKLSIQTGTYNHVLYCAYPANEVWGVEINGAIFTKSKIAEFPRVPVRRTPEMMDVWLNAVNHLIDSIERDTEVIQACSESDAVLDAFTPSYHTCSNYSGCSYFNFCLAWPNPLQHVDEVPEGFMVKHWNPAKQEARQKVSLEGGKIV